MKRPEISNIFPKRIFFLYDFRWDPPGVVRIDPYNPWRGFFIAAYQVDYASILIFSDKQKNYFIKVNLMKIVPSEENEKGEITCTLSVDESSVTDKKTLLDKLNSLSEVDKKIRILKKLGESGVNVPIIGEPSGRLEKILVNREYNHVGFTVLDVESFTARLGTTKEVLDFLIELTQKNKFTPWKVMKNLKERKRNG
jgi:hypothetical protein